MIDIHSHILPGMDDGAADFETAATMLKIAREDGITAMIATPHADLRYTYNPDRCRQELDRISGLCADAPVLYCGCELHLTPENVDAVLRRPKLFTLNGKDCLLLELPNLVPPLAVASALQVLTDHGIRPMIAHPERNVLFQQDPTHAGRFRELGAFLQITAQSITGSFGPDAQRTSEWLLKRNLADVVASDAHGVSHRRPILSRAYADVANRFGHATADLIFIENPHACITGARLRSPRPRRSFFALFRRSHQYPARTVEVS